MRPLALVLFFFATNLLPLAGVSAAGNALPEPEGTLVESERESVERSAEISLEVAALLRQAADIAEAEAQAARLLALMTAEERFTLVSGGNSFGLSGVPRLGVPPINFADASAGIRIIKNTPTQVYKQTTAFPAPLLLAATWDNGLAYEYARAIGEEMRAGGIHVLLGPGGNIYRMSRCGRNFEYFGEDPFLTARMMENHVLGLQSMGVAATIKHFIANETEHYRRSTNSLIDERTLNEIYLAPFKAGVEAGAWMAMTSYNQLNGEWAGQSAKIINGLLRGQLGFKWMVMSDWISTWSGVALAASGQDLEKPTGFSLKRDKEKLLGSKEIDRMALSILKTCIAAGLYRPDFTVPEWMERWDSREAVARKVNERGIVLLKNNGILPLAPRQVAATKAKILVAGTNAKREHLSGRGSGHVRGFNNKSYARAVRELFKGEVLVEDNPSDEQIREATLVLLFPGYPLKGQPAEAEALDRPFEMPDDALVARCVRLNKNTVVNLVVGGAVAMDWEGAAAAITQVFYGGQTGADVLMDILTGKVNPSGKLPFTIEKRFEDSPACGYDREPLKISSRHPAVDFDGVKATKVPCLLFNEDKSVVSVYDVEYKEGVFVGYRWYDQRKIKPRYAFGHGLSYTQFEYSGLKLEKDGERVRVRFTLKNTGARDGEEVAQVYVGDLESSEPRPEKELKNYRRVVLKSGESRELTLHLDKAAFSYWSEKACAWVLEPGDFEIKVGPASDKLPLRAKIRL